MKICLLGNAQSVHVKRWVHHFLQKRHEVFILSALNDTMPEMVRFYYLKPSHIKLRYIPVVIEEISYPLQASRLIRKIRPDVLHAFYAEFYGWLGALSRFHPFVLTVFGGDIVVDPQKSRYIKSKVACALRCADRITAQSRTMIEALMIKFKITKNKIEHIPWGVDPSIFCSGYPAEVRQLRQQLNISPHAPVILSLRRMSEHYQIEQIIKSMPLILERHPETIFVFLANLDRADKGQYQKAMITLAQKLNVLESARFLAGTVAHANVPIFLNMAHIAVSIPRTDQFGLSVLEAMACGTIVIVNQLDCYHEYLADGQNAFYIDPGQPAELARKIDFCLRHPEIRQRFYVANQEIIHEHEDWNRNALKMDHLYKQLLCLR